MARIVCTACADGKTAPIYEDVKEGEFSKEMPTRRRIPQELKSMLLNTHKMSSLANFRCNNRVMERVKEEFDWIKANPHRWPWSRR